jgi:hypothetical protein
MPEARTVLITERDLDGAYERVHPPAHRFEESLVRAARNTEEALSQSSAYDGNPALLETGKNLAKTAHILRRVMEHATSDEEAERASEP